MTRPHPTEYGAYYTGYIRQVPDGDILEILEVQRDETSRLLTRVSTAQETYRYAPGKWSVKEVVGHMADAERVFAYRALRFSRNDSTPLPGFDQDAYVAAAHFERRALPDLAAELYHQRTANLLLFRGFDAEEALRTGTASDHPFSVRALAYILAGHERHHVRILQERYGLS